jgi:predicted HTH transcriptional regulator
MDNFTRVIIPFAVTSSNTDENVAEKYINELSERQQLIIKTILGIAQNVAQNVAENVAEKIIVNTKYLSERLGVNRKTVQRDLTELVEKNLVRWVGSDKTGHWEVIEKGLE